MTWKVLILVGVLLCLVFWVNYQHARPHRSANACSPNLRQIDGVKQQWAMDQHKATNDVPTWEDLRGYFKGGYIPECRAGGTYTIGRVDEPPKCSVGGPDHALLP